MKIHHLKRCPLSKSNIFDQKFMKLNHIVKYHDVFFKFDNCPYRTMLLAVMALCLLKFTVLNDVHSWRWIVLIRILWNLVILFSAMMSSSSSITVHIVPCFWQLWPFVYLEFTVLNDVHSWRWIVLIRILWNLVTLFSTMISSSSSIMVHIAPCFWQLWPFVYLKFTVLNDVHSRRWIVLIRILWNLVTLLSTRMSSSLIIVYMAPCFKELLPLVYEKLSVETISAL